MSSTSARFLSAASSILRRRLVGGGVDKGNLGVVTRGMAGPLSM
jgi:hypothetical protein